MNGKQAFDVIVIAVGWPCKENSEVVFFSMPCMTELLFCRVSIIGKSIYRVSRVKVSVQKSSILDRTGMPTGEDPGHTNQPRCLWGVTPLHQ